METRIAAQGRDSSISDELELEDVRLELADLNHRLAVLEGRYPPDVIVIYDTDALLAQILQRDLLRMLGDVYEIIIATSDAAVLATVGTRMAALLITSVPTGWELIDAVKALSPATEILAETMGDLAGSLETFEIAARTHGVDYIVFKPYHFGLLRVQVRQALARTRP